MDEIAFYIRNRSLFYNARSLPANAPARYLIVPARCPRTLPRTLPTHARCPRTLPRTLPTHAARSLPAHVPPYAPQRNWPQDYVTAGLWWPTQAHKQTRRQVLRTMSKDAVRALVCDVHSAQGPHMRSAHTGRDKCVTSPMVALMGIASNKC